MSKLPLEIGNYVVTTGTHEDFKEEVYLVKNQTTGITEFSTPVLPQAFSAAMQFQEHMVEIEKELAGVKPTLTVVDSDTPVQ